MAIQYNTQVKLREKEEEEKKRLKDASNLPPPVETQEPPPTLRPKIPPLDRYPPFVAKTSTQAPSSNAKDQAPNMNVSAPQIPSTSSAIYLPAIAYRERQQAMERAAAKTTDDQVVLYTDPNSKQTMNLPKQITQKTGAGQFLTEGTLPASAQATSQFKTDFRDTDHYMASGQGALLYLKQKGYDISSLTMDDALELVKTKDPEKYHNLTYSSSHTLLQERYDQKILSEIDEMNALTERVLSGDMTTAELEDLYLNTPSFDLEHLRKIREQDPNIATTYIDTFNRARLDLREAISTQQGKQGLSTREEPKPIAGPPSPEAWMLTTDAQQKLIEDMTMAERKQSAAQGDAGLQDMLRESWNDKTSDMVLNDLNALIFKLKAGVMPYELIDELPDPSYFTDYIFQKSKGPKGLESVPEYDEIIKKAEEYQLALIDFQRNGDFAEPNSVSILPRQEPLFPQSAEDRYAFPEDRSLDQWKNEAENEGWGDVYNRISWQESLQAKVQADDAMIATRAQKTQEAKEAFRSHQYATKPSAQRLLTLENQFTDPDGRIVNNPTDAELVEMTKLRVEVGAARQEQKRLYADYKQALADEMQLYIEEFVLKCKDIPATDKEIDAALAFYTSQATTDQERMELARIPSQDLVVGYRCMQEFQRKEDGFFFKLFDGVTNGALSQSNINIGVGVWTTAEMTAESAVRKVGITLGEFATFLVRTGEWVGGETLPLEERASTQVKRYLVDPEQKKLQNSNDFLAAFGTQAENIIYHTGSEVLKTLGISYLGGTLSHSATGAGMISSSIQAMAVGEQKFQEAIVLGMDPNDAFLYGGANALNTFGTELVGDIATSAKLKGSAEIFDLAESLGKATLKESGSAALLMIGDLTKDALLEGRQEVLETFGADFIDSLFYRIVEKDGERLKITEEMWLQMSPEEQIQFVETSTVDGPKLLDSFVMGVVYKTLVNAAAMPIGSLSRMQVDTKMAETLASYWRSDISGEPVVSPSQSVSQQLISLQETQKLELGDPAIAKQVENAAIDHAIAKETATIAREAAQQGNIAQVMQAHKAAQAELSKAAAGARMARAQLENVGARRNAAYAKGAEEGWTAHNVAQYKNLLEQFGEAHTGFKAAEAQVASSQEAFYQARQQGTALLNGIRQLATEKVLKFLGVGVAKADDGLGDTGDNRMKGGTSESLAGPLEGDMEVPEAPLSDTIPPPNREDVNAKFNELDEGNPADPLNNLSGREEQVLPPEHGNDGAWSTGKKFSELTSDEASKIANEYKKRSPVEIPESATVKVESRKGYEQISYKWNDLDYKHEVRWHTRTPDAPLEQGDTWVIERIVRGSGGTPAKHFFKIGNTGTESDWVQGWKWFAAITARKAGTATPEQIEILDLGHWKE